MLIRQTGKCEKCGADFSSLDTIQSTEVECSKCNKTISICKFCKEKGCECGGTLLNALDKNPGLLF